MPPLRLLSLWVKRSSAQSQSASARRVLRLSRSALVSAIGAVVGPQLSPD